MNIFVLDTDPKIAASYHCDKHVLKMILESAQMLCTALHLFDVPNVPYRKTHENHPCSVWARSTRDNYLWLCSLGLALCEEYTERYGKTHKTQAVIEWCLAHSHCIPAGDKTPHPQCMPDKYVQTNVVSAYRAYYKEEKVSIAKWRIKTPSWW